MVRQTTKVIVLEILGVFSLLLMAGIAVLAIMLVRGPVEIGMFRDDVEQAMTDARGGRAVSVDRLTLQWSPSDRRLFAVAHNLSLKDDEGEEAGKVSRADLTLDAGALFTGNVEVLRAAMIDGTVDARSIGPNMWSLAGEPLPSLPEGELPQSPQEWLDRVNTVMADVLNGLEVSQESFRLESLTLENVDVRVFDAEGGAIGQIGNLEGSIDRTGSDLAIAFSGEGDGLGLPGGFDLALNTSGMYQAVRGDLVIEDLPLSDLADRVAISALSGGSFVMDIGVGAGLTKAGGLQELSLSLDHKSGELLLPQWDEKLEALSLALSYAPDADAINISELAIASERVDGTFSGRIEEVLSKSEARPIALSSEGFDLDLTPLFPQAWSIGQTDVEIVFSDDYQTAEIKSASADLGDAILSAFGEVDFSPENEGRIPISLDLNAEVAGEFGKDLVLSFWPETLGRGARLFTDQRVPEITVTEANASLALRPDSLDQGFLRDGDLGVSFSFKDGMVRFLDDVPPAANLVGAGRLSGNGFGVTVFSGTLSDWKLHTGQVEFPAFMPRGERFTVTAEGEGPAVSVLNILAESRLQLRERTGFDPRRVSGDGSASFFLSRPALSDVPFDDVVIEVDGKIRNGGLADAGLGFNLSEAETDVSLKDNTLVLNGFGEFGPIPVQFSWRDDVRDEDSPALLSSSAIVTPDLLNQFGLIGRAYLSGEIPVDMQGKVSAGGLGEADFSFDLREARISVDEIGWVKPAGEPARATVSYFGDGLSQASALRLVSDTAELDGDLKLAQSGRLDTLTLRKLWVENVADVAGTVRRTSDELAEVDLSGAFLDVGPFIGDMMAMGGSGDGETLPLKFKANVETLRLRRGLDLTDARVDLDSAEGFLRYVDAAGIMPGGERLSVSYESAGLEAVPEISLTAGDAGFIGEAFLGLDFIEGGQLNLTGTLATKTEPADLLATIKDARLADAPFVTQILSLASLRGLADTLSGEGVLFTTIEAPIKMGGGRYIIDGGRASGPALGLTMNGWVATDGKGINLDGVLVPSFGVNSVLGGVPVIGDLFVGREGEGIFSITYSVRGSLEKAQVAVNPLSAVTPGILRRIFENPSDTSIPEALPIDPNLKPPQPKLPELPDDEILGDTPGGG